MSLEDQSIRSTDNDALISRESAVRLGYLDDPFSTYFIQEQPSPRRPPLINVGTHLRTWSIDELFWQFLSNPISASASSSSRRKRQVVSIGAGSDTRAFRLFEQIRKQKQEAQSSSLSSSNDADVDLKYLEIDFEQVTSQKVKTILSNEHIRNLCRDIRYEEKGDSTRNSLHSANYILLPCDLRSDFTAPNKTDDSPASSLADLILANLNPDVPTLLLAECVLVYMAPQQSQKLLTWFSETFSEVGAITYEMTNPDDPFGKVMVRNLKARGLSLPGLSINTTIQTQALRLKAAKFDHADVHSLLTVRQRDVSREERQRVAKLELLDEVEELNLILSHYAIAWAYKTSIALNESAFHSFTLNNRASKK